MQIDSGDIDTVGPKEVDVEDGYTSRPMPETSTTYGDKTVVGNTESGEGVRFRILCADVKKVLGSVHKMNMGDNVVVVLDGERSYM